MVGWPRIYYSVLDSEQCRATSEQISASLACIAADTARLHGERGRSGCRPVSQNC